MVSRAPHLLDAARYRPATAAVNAFATLILTQRKDRSATLSKLKRRFAMPPWPVLSAAPRFARDRRAVIAIEWTFIASLIAIVLIASAAPNAETFRPYLVDTADAVEDVRTLN